MKRFFTIFLLMCATSHAVLSFFYVNQSYLELHLYAAGQQNPTFQRRMLMIPITRWAEGNPLLQKIALRFGRTVPQLEPMTAIKLSCIIAGILLLSFLGFYTIRFSRRLGLRQDWIIWALFVAIFYAECAARYEQPLWYPYDLPHIFLFGMATIFLLENRLWPFLAFLFLDITLRETSLFLIVCAFVLNFKSRRWNIALGIAFLLWASDILLGIHLYPGVRYHSKPSDMIPYLLKPWQWPQLFSIVGFLWIPVWMNREKLSSVQRRLLATASLLMIVSFYPACWAETRVWSEWSILFATLAGLQLEKAYRAVDAEVLASECV